MIPRKLTMEGVYSYREKQTIDFESLTGGGIFGIFGAVGSGKSAILESMTYALYGQIERLSQTEQRGYNMMNLQSERMFIDFEFSHEKTLYRFTVSAKRQKKNFDVISTPERLGYCRKGEEWIPLEDQKIRGGITAESILGLSYEHFRRTVIIPQGKFQEFIQLTPSQRTGMIESLFNLEKFNLYGKSASLLTKARSHRAFQQGRMEELEKFRKEDLEQLDQERQILVEKLTVLDTGLRQKKEALKIQEESAALFQEKSRLLQTQKSLQSRIPEFEERQKRLKLYKEIYAGFHLLVHQKESLNSDASIKEDHKQHLLSKQSALKKEERDNKQRWENLKSSWEEKDSLKERLRSLTAAEEIHQIQIKSEAMKAERDALEKELQSCRRREEEQSRLKDQLQSDIEKKEKTLPDWNALHQVEEWFMVREQLQKDRDTQKSETAELLKEKQDLRTSLQAELETDGPPPGSRDIEKLFQERMEELSAELKRMKQELSEKEIRLHTEKRLMALSGELKEGEPCPVCGSPDHPRPLSTGEFNEQENAIETAGRELSKKERALSSMQIAWNRYSDGSDRIDRKLPEKEKQLAETEKRLENHRRAFCWEAHKADEPEEFQLFKKSAQTLQASLREDYQKLNIYGDTLKELGFLSESVRKREREISLETGKLSAAEATWREQLSPEHQKELPERAGQEQQRLRDHLNRLEREYPRALEGKEAREKALQRLESELNTVQALLDDLAQRKSEQNESIQKTLQTSGLESIQEAEKILALNLNTEQEENALEEFTKERSILENRLKQLQTHLSDRPFREEELNALQQSIREAELERSRLTASRGALEKQREDLTSGLIEKAKSEEALKKTLVREENLKELTSLFKGKKFTEYIAAIYLQELCHRANERFFPLSGRTLELVFEDNVILIRDYLNEGKTRLVKTLSGGQTFQAALSLALALAEQTGRGEDHFFFLDEGFGTLDRDSLETVMATLRQISREGRIIGLISHVEEMKQDLDVWLGISRLPEKGSQIRCSWKQEGEK